MKNQLNWLRQTTVGACSIALNKTGASLRLGAGIAGDVTAVGGQLVGGTLAVAGGALALTGFGVYAAGMVTMGAATKLALASQEMSDKAYDELVGTTAEERAANGAQAREDLRDAYVAEAPATA